MGRLNFDPLNIVICGIGGQGNVLASELVSSTMNDLGYKVAVGETYGAAQRGGSVMSHVRVSESFEMGVLIPRGEAAGDTQAGKTVCRAPDPDHLRSPAGISPGCPAGAAGVSGSESDGGGDRVPRRGCGPGTGC